MSTEENQAQLLNEFFKSLGQVDEESQKWKEYHESIDKMMQLLFEFMASRSEIFNTQLYGSPAENLKNYSFDDVGDVDLLMSYGGDCFVDENMLEYLPNNPAFVKIKGRSWASAVPVDSVRRHRIRIFCSSKGIAVSRG